MEHVITMILLGYNAMHRQVGRLLYGVRKYAYCMQLIVRECYQLMIVM